MSLLSSIAGSAFKAFVLPKVAEVALRAAGPGVQNLLQKVVGTGFDIAKFAAPFAVQSFLPGPLGALAQTLLDPLIGKGMDALKNMTQSGIQNAVQGYNSSPYERPVFGSDSMSDMVLPTLGSIATNYGASSVGDTIGSTISNFFGGGDVESQLANAAQGLREPRFPGANASEGDLLKYQTDLQKYARLMDMYSKIIQAHHDMKKGIIANFRV